jgi:chromosome partitioning protein
MKTIALLNEKGGIGKTTMSMLLASAAARRGYNVLFVDADPQGSATSQFRVQPYSGLHDLVINEASWNDVLSVVPGDYYGGNDNHLLLLGSNHQTSQLSLASAWQQHNNRTQYLTERLAQLTSWADFVIIDTAPSLSDIHTAVYQAADYMIMPTMCSRMSVQGIINSLGHLEQMRQALTPYGIDIATLLGIVPTMFYGRELVQHQTLGRLQGRFGDSVVLEPIKRRAIWEQASAKRQPVYVYDPASRASKEASEFVDTVLGRVV